MAGASGSPQAPSGAFHRARVRFSENSLILTGLIGTAYILAYVFYLILSRNLPIEVFGLVGTYLAGFGVLSLLSSSIIYSAAKLVAEGGEGAAARVRSSYLKALRPFVAAAVVAAAAVAPVSAEAATLLGAAAIVPIRDLQCGVLNGLKLNARFGGVVLAEALLRIAGALLTAVAPFAWIALAAWLLSNLFGAALGTVLLPPSARAHGRLVSIRPSTAHSALLRLPQVSFLNTDVILTTALLGAGRASGLYVAAALLSRIPFYLVTPFAMGEFPKMVQERGRGIQTRRAVVLSLGGAILFAAPLALLPGLALVWGFGAEYGPAAGALFWLSMTGLLLIQVHSLALALFASGNVARTAAVLAFAALLEIALILALAPGGIEAIAFATAVGALAALVPLVVFFVAPNREWHSAE